MSGSILERKVTKFGNFLVGYFIKKVFINGNNSVRTRSSLRDNDLCWWLALLMDLASGSVR